jgi:hypothetical protein
MSIVIRVFDETGHIGYLGFNADGPYITSLDKAYEYDDTEGAQYDAQRFAMEHFGVFNTCPVVEEAYLRYQAVVWALKGWDIVSQGAADPSGRYGVTAKKANLALNFYACLDYESFEIYDRTDDGLPEQGIGYGTADGDTPFTTEVLARIIANTF